MFSFILLYSLYIFTAAQSKAQTDYFVKIRAKRNNIHNKEHISIIKSYSHSKDSANIKEVARILITVCHSILYKFCLLPMQGQCCDFLRMTFSFQFIRISLVYMVNNKRCNKSFTDNKQMAVVQRLHWSVVKKTEN